MLMKHRYLFLFLLFFASVTVVARQVTPNEALRIATEFYTSASASKVMTRSDGVPSLSLAYTSVGEPAATTRQSSAPTQNTYYVFNADDGKGFVVVAGHDRARRILAYSFEDSFGIDEQPVQLRAWLTQYDKEIQYLFASESGSEGNINAGTYYDERANPMSAKSVEPLLGNIRWNQDAPFNKYCPMDIRLNNMVTPVGCVATAAVQIMKYHEYPKIGSGKKEYVTTTLRMPLSANFGETTYEWENMLDDYNGNYSEVQANAAALISYHVGIGCSMDYDATGSGAVPYDMLKAFKQYFLYDKNIDYVDRTHYPESDWIAVLKSELDNRRPMLYFGEGPGGGHAFVCDGYDTNDLFHFNWGWGGISNGYYQISALEPEDLGTGGGLGAYNHTQSIIIGIQPPNDQSTHLARLQLGGGIIVQEEDMDREGTNNITISFYNYGMRNFTGEVVLALYKEDALLQVLAVKPLNNLPEISGGTDAFTFKNVAIPAEVENGTYQLYVAHKEQGVNDYTIMRTPIGYPNYCLVNVDDQTISITEPAYAPNLSLVKKPEVITSKLYAGRKGTFSITVKNDGEEYYSFLGIRLQKRDETRERLDVGVILTRIPKGATRTLEYSTDNLDVTPGEYNVVAVYDPKNRRNTYFDPIGPNEFIATQTTILPEPADPSFSLASTVKIAAADGSSTIGVNESVVITARISNTGGYGDGKFAVLFVNDRNELVGNSSIVELSIDSRKLASFKVTHKLSYPAGQYGILLATVSGVIAEPLLPEMFNRTTFWITQGTGIEETTTGASALSCYESEGYLYLKVDAEKPIKAAGITDVSGKLVRTVTAADENTRIFVGDLPSGLYIIQAETDQGVLRCKWMKN